MRMRWGGHKAEVRLRCPLKMRPEKWVRSAPLKTARPPTRDGVEVTGGCCAAAVLRSREALAVGEAKDICGGIKGSDYCSVLDMFR